MLINKVLDNTNIYEHFSGIFSDHIEKQTNKNIHNMPLHVGIAVLHQLNLQFNQHEPHWGCAKHSLSGFITVAAHSTTRLHLPVVILSKSLQAY